MLKSLYFEVLELYSSVLGSTEEGVALFKDCE